MILNNLCSKYRKIRIFKIAKYRKISIFRHSQNQEMVPDRIFTRYIAKRKKSIDQLWIELLIGNYFRVTSSENFLGGSAAFLRRQVGCVLFFNLIYRIRRNASGNIQRALQHSCADHP